VEELESFIEQIMAVPLLMRVLAHFFHNDYFGAAQPERRFEGRPYSLQDVNTQQIGLAETPVSKLKKTVIDRSAATRRVTLSIRHFLVAEYAGTLCANMMS